MVRRRDLEANKIIRHYHLSGVYALSLYPMLAVLVTAGRVTHSRIHILSGHTPTVADVKYQQSEPQVITGSMDWTVRLHGGNNIKWTCPEGAFVCNFGGRGVILNTLTVNAEGGGGVSVGGASEVESEGAPSCSSTAEGALLTVGAIYEMKATLENQNVATGRRKTWLAARGAARRETSTGGERRASHPYIGNAGAAGCVPVRPCAWTGALRGCCLSGCCLSGRRGFERCVGGGWARDGRDEPRRGGGREIPWHTNVVEEARPVEGGPNLPYNAARAASNPFYLSFLSLLHSQSFDLI
ncbi:hypothetical protein DFH08DRAFT_991892 [Mycena albidolilacea]|uniref:Pre-mRNA-splicing factor PRP46 n=1 Tax=Mycena albidolilacea TaxID=1033008 RepID=A0AAD6Z053_9AGAR|nr:hypothetical protein DFH08DRAFT_991892 [Mycena albidolilacea]